MKKYICIYTMLFLFSISNGIYAQNCVDCSGGNASGAPNKK